MRTTITLEPDVQALIRTAMKERGITFKEALNSAVRRAGPFALAAVAPPRASDVHSGRSGETRFGGPA